MKAQVRKGYTLLEMVTVIALIGTVLTLSAGILLLSLKADRSLGQEMIATRAVAALATQLRSDIHRTAGSQLELTEDQKLILYPVSAVPNVRSEYSFVPQGLVREETSPSGEVLKRDYYRFSTNLQQKWTIEPEQRLLHLELTTLPEAATVDSDKSVNTTLFRPVESRTITAQIGKLLAQRKPLVPSVSNTETGESEQ